MTRRSAEAGFSLIETLVSLTIIAGMAGMLFETIGTQARAAQNLAQRREAVMLAGSLLAQATVAPGQAGLAEAGQWHGMRWRQTHRAVAGGARDSGPPLEEIRIDIVDRDSGRRLTSVRTLRLGRWS